MTTENYFSKLAQIDCSEHVEKKGRLSTLLPIAIQDTE